MPSTNELIRVRTVLNRMTRENCTIELNRLTKWLDSVEKAKMDESKVPLLKALQDDLQAATVFSEISVPLVMNLFRVYGNEQFFLNFLKQLK